VEHDDGVLPRLHQLVEVADRAEARGHGERAVEPHRLAAAHEPAAGEVAAVRSS
jgi:hypothetical protein